MMNDKSPCDVEITQWCVNCVNVHSTSCRTCTVNKPLTGGSVDYYKVRISAPTSGSDAYTAECNDIIEALGMTFAEGNILKALWRIAAARNGNGKPGTTARYDAEKIVFFAARVLAAQRRP